MMSSPPLFCSGGTHFGNAALLCWNSSPSTRSLVGGIQAPFSSCHYFAAGPMSFQQYIITELI